MNKSKNLNTKSASYQNGAALQADNANRTQCALLLGTLCIGRSTIENATDSAETLKTRDVCRALGADITINNKTITIHGVGVGGLQQPQNLLDKGNALESCCHAIGLLSTHPLRCFVQATLPDSSAILAQIIPKLEKRGANFESNGFSFPIMVNGTAHALPMRYRLDEKTSPVVKSALLFSGLNCAGTTTVIEQYPSSDYLEQMLALFGVCVSIQQDKQKAKHITIQGHQELLPATITLP